MTDAQRQILLEAYLKEAVHEIECPRCIRYSQLMDDCPYCGGVWMIPLARIAYQWIERELAAASSGDRPEWLRNGLYHVVDTSSGDIDRWLVSEHGIWYVTREEYLAAWERRKSRREESAVAKFVHKIFGGGS